MYRFREDYVAAVFILNDIFGITFMKETIQIKKNKIL